MEKFQQIDSIPSREEKIFSKLPMKSIQMDFMNFLYFLQKNKKSWLIDCMLLKKINGMKN